MKKFDENEILERLQNTENWDYTDKQLVLDIKLKDFISVVALVNKIADEAEKMNHHPDIFIHSWNRLRLTLSTHSEGGITQKDFDLAGKINKIIENSFKL